MTVTPISYGARLRHLAAERGSAEAVRFLPAKGEEQSLSWQALGWRSQLKVNAKHRSKKQSSNE